MVTLTRDQARARLSRMVAGEPVLSVEDLDLLVGIAQVGLLNPNGTAAYDLNKGAGEGWAWKAAKAAEQVSVAAEGSSIERQQVWEHCMRMERLYATQRAMLSVVKFGRSDVLR